jgi:hypothetical protein
MRPFMWDDIAVGKDFAAIPDTNTLWQIEAAYSKQVRCG